MECKIRDCTIHYEVIGEGRPVVMLHGWPLDHRHIAKDMEPIFATRAGWRRIYLDLPGMGKTRAPDWITQQDQILDLVSAFIDSVAPGERFVVVGESYGAYLARGLVHHRGDQMDGVLLNVPVIAANPTPDQLPSPLVVHDDAAFLTALAANEQDLPGFIVAQSMDLLADMREAYQPAVEIADDPFLQRLRQQYEFKFAVDALPSPFAAPTLILTGRHDHWCGYMGAYQILENYPRASFAVLDRAGHALSLEQKTLFRALVSEWVDRVEEYLDCHDPGAICHANSLH